MGLFPRRMRMKVEIPPARRRKNSFWGPGPNPPLSRKENVYYSTLPPRQSQIFPQCMNNSIIILCSSWAGNKRTTNYCTWRKLCHHLLPLPHFADAETEAHQVNKVPKAHTRSYRAQVSVFVSQSSDQGSFLYCRWQNPPSSSEPSLRDIPKTSLLHSETAAAVQTHAALLGAGHTLLLSPGIPVWPTLTSPQHSQLSQPHTKAFFFVPTLTPCLTSLFCHTAELLIVWAYEGTCTRMHMHAYTPRRFTHIWLDFCGSPWQDSPSHPVPVTRSPSSHTPRPSLG